MPYSLGWVALEQLYQMCQATTGPNIGGVDTNRIATPRAWNIMGDRFCQVQQICGQ